MQKVKAIYTKYAERWQLAAFITYLQRANLTNAGATIAYYTILSLVPVLMSVGSVASMIGFNHKQIYELMENSLPQNIASALNPILGSVLGGNAGTLSLALLVALWGASRVLGVIRTSFNTVHDVSEKINSLFARIFGFLWLFVLLAGAGIVLLGTSIARIVVNSVPINVPVLTSLLNQSQIYGAVGLWIILVLFNFALPALRLKRKAVLIGSAIETIMMVVLNHGFSWYASLAIRNANFYQAMGTLIILMVYVNLIGVILVLTHVIIAWLSDLMEPTERLEKQSERTSH
ncbi:putative membrane protein [Weissella oryzae SG25]|uniref:Putative membrane protein n=1 Tax=Weissella oryzae (strain DSM 25784 / JCM 18191 / LMG 30913 / SG25) TaxID=1329250 RepID=A0A069D1X6_WEIOS|nr:YihY/virulence factor BrkB family protein [Weissella oryzae]GAK31361.1 putative membrane protein [Weissella oryzae SG25]